jgi:holo-[acyl-carrier protein] synthase
VTNTVVETNGEPAGSSSDSLVSSGVMGLGLDALDIDRFRRVLERRPALSRRAFTDEERADAAASSDPAPHLAARFCAKEAVMKALGVGLGAVGLKEIGVRRLPGGAPKIEVTGRAAALCEEMGVDDWLVSLTHTDALAMAVVLGLGHDVTGATLATGATGTTNAESARGPRSARGPGQETQG